MKKLSNATRSLPTHQGITYVSSVASPKGPQNPPQRKVLVTCPSVNIIIELCLMTNDHRK